MYNWISSKLPPKLAIAVAGFLYASMLLAILYFSFEQEATFNYLVI